MANEEIRKEYNGATIATTLAITISAGSTSVTLTSGATFPTGGTAPFVIAIGRDTPTEEKLLASSRAGNVLTILERGYDGTSAQAHTAGANVSHVLDAHTLTQANRFANTMTTAGDLVHKGAGTTFTRLAVGSSGLPVVSNGTNPAYAQLGTAGIADNAITSAKIVDNTIVNADINAAAAIGYGKLALTNSVVNADVATGAAIALTKLASITAGSVLLGNASNVPTATALTGDVTVSSAGVTAIGASKVTSAMIVDGTITGTDIAGTTIATANLADSSVTSAKIADDTIVNGDINSAAGITYNKLAAIPKVRLRRAANQAVTAGQTTITWDTEDADTDGFIAVSSNTITIPAGLGGMYSICGRIVSSTAFPGNSYIVVTAGGVAYAFHIPSVSTQNNGAYSVTCLLNASATVEVACFLSSGSSNFTGNLEMCRLGA